MMPRYLALLCLAATSCTVMAKVYRIEPLLPDGEPVPQQRRGYGHAVVSVAGLDISVSSVREELAGWISPLLLPPVIPLPTGDRWDQPADIVVYFEFRPTRTGYTFSPSHVRLHVDGRDSVVARAWSGGPLVKGGAFRQMTHVPEEKIEINARLYISIAFPVPSPLEDRAELQIGGLELDGAGVEIPLLFLRPAYSVEWIPLS